MIRHLSIPFYKTRIVCFRRERSLSPLRRNIHEYFTYIFLFYGKSLGDARKKWLLYL
ncbi:hypothetical protein CLOSYM_02903 [[Clostridium] symbiosum ATCC 14940]|uniref:Uncharacterized protein n=1 Tax=[Clostridium] symbiosum ATCC 14940 TaxID=411472 RepID=A0ABC9TW13_CLOSY|nr:hypothetical protein CLOSYM_02903 [[Clostridium] symbiosum ATCC 14940]